MRAYTVFVCLFGFLLATASAQLGGSLSSSPSGGQDFNVNLGKQFGDAKENIAGGLFASGNTLKGPVTTGAFLNAHKDGIGAGLQHSKTPGFGSTFQQSLTADLLNKGNHNLGANAFHSRTNLDNGFNFDRIGGGLNYNHAAGHAASLSASHIPQLDMNTFGLNGKANLWRSQDHRSTFDLNGGISKNFGGPFDGQVNKNIGVGFTHLFGR